MQAHRPMTFSSRPASKNRSAFSATGSGRSSSNSLLNAAAKRAPRRASSASTRQSLELAHVRHTRSEPVLDGLQTSNEPEVLGEPSRLRVVSLYGHVSRPNIQLRGDRARVREQFRALVSFHSFAIQRIEPKQEHSIVDDVLDRRVIRMLSEKSLIILAHESASSDALLLGEQRLRIVAHMPILSVSRAGDIHGDDVVSRPAMLEHGSRHRKSQRASMVEARCVRASRRMLRG